MLSMQTVCFVVFCLNILFFFFFFDAPCDAYYWSWNGAHKIFQKNFIIEDILLVAWFIQQHSPE